MTRMVGGTVAFPVSREVAFDYLSDPAHRAEWQSSLRGVADITGGAGVGQRWTDVTLPGLRPAMRTTVWERPQRWSETGTWRGVAADLSLAFIERAGDGVEKGGEGEGCEVRFDFRVHLLGPVGLLVTAASVVPVRADLKRAAAILAGRH